MPSSPRRTCHSTAPSMATCGRRRWTSFASRQKGTAGQCGGEGIRANSTRGFLGMDPYVAILNKDRFALVSADDTPLLRQDCWVSVMIPEDGAYTVEIRDSAYEGNGRYRAHLGTFPRPTAAYPAGGQPGHVQTGFRPARQACETRVETGKKALPGACAFYY